MKLQPRLQDFMNMTREEIEFSFLEELFQEIGTEEQFTKFLEIVSKTNRDGERARQLVSLMKDSVAAASANGDLRIGELQERVRVIMDLKRSLEEDITKLNDKWLLLIEQTGL